jgi:hypothetical protein
MNEKLYRVDQFYPGDFAQILTGVYMKNSTDSYLLSEISKSATIPIGMWMSYHADPPFEQEKMSPEEIKEKFSKLSAKFKLIESNRFLSPNRNLEYTEFQSLKGALAPLGYRYELARGFVKA